MVDGTESFERDIQRFDKLHAAMHMAVQNNDIYRNQVKARQDLLNWMENYLSINAARLDIATVDVANPVIIHIFNSFRDTIGENNTVLQWWIVNDCEQQALYLLKKMQTKGININIINETDSGKNTPLSLAISKKYLSTMQRDNYFYRYNYHSARLINFLIENSNDDTLKRQNFYGNTPLHIAIIKRDYNTTRQLLEEAKKRNIDLLTIKNRDGKTPFEMLNIKYEEAYATIRKIYDLPIPMFTEKEWSMQKNRILKLQQREVSGQLLTAKSDTFEITPIARILQTDSVDGIKGDIEKIISNASKMALQEYNISNANLKIKILLEVIVQYEEEIVNSQVELKPIEREGVKYYRQDPKFIQYLQQAYKDRGLSESVNQDEIQTLSKVLQHSSDKILDAPHGKFYKHGGARTHRIARLLKYSNSIEDKSFTRY